MGASQIARNLVTEKHSHLRRISKSRQPMIEHIAEVAAMVESAGADDHIIAAAWLHDTIEDTDVTLEDIRAKFGDKVAEIVDGLTDPPHFEKMPTAERKAEQAKRLLSKDKDVRLVKLCDQISNIRSVVNDTPPDWNDAQQWAYIEGAAKIARLCAGINDALDMEFEKAYDEAELYYKDKVK